MKAGYLQFAPQYLRPTENRDAVADHISTLDADLLVLPELFTSGYFFQSQAHLQEVAEPIPDGTTTQALREWASATGTTLVAGLAERDGEVFYNSAVLVRPDGSTETYRKVHLFYEETERFEPGNLGFPVFEASTRDGTSYMLGMMVCFDWYFPEAARSLALQGADVIAHPSNLVLPHCPDSMPVRARENHVYTITANRFGTETNETESLTFIGMSEICAPTGDILHRGPRDEVEIAIESFDPHEARSRDINRYNDTLGDRRPETYVTEQTASGPERRTTH
ncbi:acyltransferase [Salinibacter sp. 10B]|uniref:nitrilase-related carbon-nitrogen hydrolase n=1 Tax=Salinibacter sp. 10B TaxID=1923971 RepID=UPI000CF53CAB|nr:nitrilase-related carbon-nitrogen hydrolase [Salinibacter sp. 10B]PQJ33485.1 acyltransferase [Salinibacter sp. 10B]